LFAQDRHPVCIEQRTHAMTATVNKTPSDEVTAIRREFLTGLAPIPTFAEATGKSKRTIQRLVAIGALPVVTLGRTKFVNVTALRKNR
jgi:hypothetical protein